MRSRRRIFQSTCNNIKPITNKYPTISSLSAQLKNVKDQLKDKMNQNMKLQKELKQRDFEITNKLVQDNKMKELEIIYLKLELNRWRGKPQNKVWNRPNNIQFNKLIYNKNPGQLKKINSEIMQPNYQFTKSLENNAAKQLNKFPQQVFVKQKINIDQNPQRQSLSDSFSIQPNQRKSNRISYQSPLEINMNSTDSNHISSSQEYNFQIMSFINKIQSGPEELQ